MSPTPAPEAAASGGSTGSGRGAPSSIGPTAGDPTLKQLEERIARLESALAAQETKLVEVEKTAKKKGGLVMLVTQFGVPFALWYALWWGGMCFGIYMMLETGLVSWQDSLRPLLVAIGLEAWVQRIDPTMGNLVIAFLVNELLESVRFPLVLATGMPAIRLLRRYRGKPPDL